MPSRESTSTKELNLVQLFNRDLHSLFTGPGNQFPEFVIRMSYFTSKGTNHPTGMIQVSCQENIYQVSQ